ncbi:MAG: hypothetical protein ACR2NP_20125 [Pirellulaceae bacterium]
MRILMALVMSLFGLFGLLATTALAANELVDDESVDDGVYFLAETEQGHPVSIDGKQYWLGDLATDNLGAVRLRSLNNQNSDYMVELTGCGPVPDDRQIVSMTVVMIGGEGYRISGQNHLPDDSGKQNLASRINGDQARHIARHLELTPEEREHPGHRMLVTWTPVKTSFDQMEPVEVEITIRNAGDVPILFYNGGQQRGARNNQFSFVCFFNGLKPEPDVGDPVNFGGLAAMVTLQNGEEFTQRVDLRDWFAFEETGTYILLGSFQITLHLTHENYTPLWDDWATGPLTVTIEE